MIRLKRRWNFWQSGRIQIFAVQSLMGLSPQKYIKDVHLILKRKFHTWLTVNHKIMCSPLWKKHFRQIHYGVPNFNFKYIYKKFKELRDNRRIFWRNNTKTGKQRKLRKWRDQMHHFFIILQVTMSIAIGYRPQ